MIGSEGGPGGRGGRFRSRFIKIQRTKPTPRLRRVTKSLSIREIL